MTLTNFDLVHIDFKINAFTEVQAQLNFAEEDLAGFVVGEAGTCHEVTEFERMTFTFVING